MGNARSKKRHKKKTKKRHKTCHHPTIRTRGEEQMRAVWLQVGGG
jgi:hypothetical protein